MGRFKNYNSGSIDDENLQEPMILFESEPYISNINNRKKYYQNQISQN